MRLRIDRALTQLGSGNLAKSLSHDTSIAGGKPGVPRDGRRLLGARPLRLDEQVARNALVLARPANDENGRRRKPELYSHASLLDLERIRENRPTGGESQESQGHSPPHARQARRLPTAFPAKLALARDVSTSRPPCRARR